MHICIYLNPKYCCKWCKHINILGGIFALVILSRGRCAINQMCTRIFPSLIKKRPAKKTFWQGNPWPPLECIPPSTSWSVKQPNYWLQPDWYKKPRLLLIYVRAPRVRPPELSVSTKNEQTNKDENGKTTEDKNDRVTEDKLKDTCGVKPLAGINSLVVS